MRHDQKHIFNESLMNAVARVERNVIELRWERREIGFHFTSFGFICVVSFVRIHTGCAVA